MFRLAFMFNTVLVSLLLVSCSVALEDVSKYESARIVDNKVLLSRDTTTTYTLKSVSRWMIQKLGEVSNQGADCYGNMLCQYRVDHSALEIMDMKKKRHIASISLESLGSAYHCNNADFSNVFYVDSDDFPLLYSSHQGRDARCILVDRIYRVGDEYKLETLQKIIIPYSIDIPLQYTPDAIIDNDNHFLYVYTGNTVPLTDFYLYKFHLPQFEMGTVSLTEMDIEAVWTIKDDPLVYKQGGMIKDGVIYIMEGVPGWNSDNRLRIIDLYNGYYSIINLTQGFSAIWEPEDIFWYDGSFYVASNRSGIYLLEIESSDSIE